MKKSFWFLAALMALDFFFSVVFIAWLNVFYESNVLLKSFTGFGFVAAMLVGGAVVLALNYFSLKANWFERRFPAFNGIPLLHFGCIAAWVLVDLKWIVYLAQLI